MKTSYIDLEEKEQNEKEKDLNTTAIDNMQAAELEAAGVDPTLASHKGGNFYTGTQPAVTLPESELPEVKTKAGPTMPAGYIPPGNGGQVTEEKNYYEDYISQLDESLVDPINTKKRQEDLAKAAKINATGAMINNVIDLIAGGGSNGAPIFKRTDTATPAMLNQLERLRADDARRQEVYNAQKLQNQIRGIQFGQQDKNQDRISRHFYEGQHFRKEEAEKDRGFRAEQGEKNREAQIKAQEAARTGNTEAQKELEAERFKNDKALIDHRTKKNIEEIKARYGAQAEAAAAAAAASAKGSDDDPNFYVRDDETGEIVTIPPADYWNIVQKVVTAQGTYDGEDFTINEDFKLNESQLNALVAKEWKNYPPPAGTQETTTDNKSTTTTEQAKAVYTNIMADPNVSIEDKRSMYGNYLKDNTTLTPEEIKQITDAMK